MIHPEVFLVAETQLQEIELKQYLNSIGANEYNPDPNNEEDDLTLLTAFSGKLCYRSFQAGLNKNVTKVRDNIGEYIDNIHKVGHGSVLEHVSISFVFKNVSRVFTHELVRHRVGVAISQESMRYVALDTIPMWMPAIIYNDAKARMIWEDAISDVTDSIAHLQQALIRDDMSFTEKKFITSHIRRLAPMGIATAMVWTVNVRSLRHIIQLRTSRHAEEEIRLVFDAVAQICKQRYPSLFGDMQCEYVNGYNEWLSKYPSEPYVNELLKKKDEEIIELKRKLHGMWDQQIGD